MPELPEVETTRRGIAPHLEGRRITRVVVREPRLRWPVRDDLHRLLRRRTLCGVDRRAKYLLFRFAHGTLLLHLGMSGSLRVVDADTPAAPHDHLDLEFEHGRSLRFTDPRRFGSVLWTDDEPGRHPLLRELGPEPLEGGFDGDWLYRHARGRRVSVKPFLMDGRIVVGVGNIYASESLHLAGIHPRRPAGRIALPRYERLARVVGEVLSRAIREGGTTLRDFTGGDGRPGYFRQHLRVYDRAGEPCERCDTPIRMEVLGQRASYFCPACQR
ncbi:MAG: bifunctional DNA-formamidopyrimidine glycosylase/DNA-(apurinic or apyrimidinic site) lyase [Gammaproteobacteria bacterium]